MPDYVEGPVRSRLPNCHGVYHNPQLQQKLFLKVASEINIIWHSIYCDVKSKFNNLRQWSSDKHSLKKDSPLSFITTRWPSSICRSAQCFLAITWTPDSDLSRYGSLNMDVTQLQRDFLISSNFDLNFKKLFASFRHFSVTNGIYALLLSRQTALCSMRKGKVCNEWGEKMWSSKGKQKNMIHIKLRGRGPR